MNAGHMDIRTVTVELLRAGPRHNQLVSPLTQYLGVCGNAAAGRVSLPYEHGDLELRLQELRYRVADQDDPVRRSKLLDRTGREIAQILSAVPGVSGLLNPEDEQPQTLTHLRIVLSASELAMLPFEASKVPMGEDSMSTWLALQARAPVCITRHIRSVSAEGIRWPSEPRILFVAGPDTDEPLALHRKALENVMAPWRNADGRLGDRLVVIEKATLAHIFRKVAAAAAKGAPVTHVHILAHGAPLDDTDRHSPVGLSLYDEDVISGRQLATALVAVTDRSVERPVVVTLATCDSGKVSDVRTTDASVAHDLHDQGIPLVVASQFPLSVDGSVPFVERFYQGQLWGEHPLVSLYAVRLHLHSCMGPDTHDWASLVVYEAFPSNLTDQLEELRYWQARRAQEGALRRIEALVAKDDGGTPLRIMPDGRDRYETGLRDIADMSARLPTEGPYALECAGLRAAGHKRIAQAAFQMAVAGGAPDGESDRLLAECLNQLDRARTGYWSATKSFLGPSSEPVRRKANLHWLLGQVLSLDVVLGRPLDAAFLTAARLAAEIDLESPRDEERAWACVSLSEFALLRLADPNMTTAERARHAEESIANASRFLEMLGRGSEHAATTSRQFERYAEWWGNPDLQWALAKLGVPERPHWHGEHGIVPTAKRIVALLRGPRRHPMPTNGRRNGAVAAESRPAPANPAEMPTARSARNARRSTSTFAIEMLPADNGDCLWIEYGDPFRPRRILIDCGAVSAARTLVSRIESIGVPSERVFELFVLTHIDADHINGALPLFGNANLDARFEDIWFNGWHQVSQFLSVKQGEDFSKLLEDPARSLPWNRAVTSKRDRHPAPIVLPSDKPPPTFELPGGLRLTLLSPGAEQLKRLGREWRQALLELEPGKAMLGRRRPPPPVADFVKFDLEALARKPVTKDTSVANGSSIALLAEFKEHAILLTGDAHADVLAKSITALQQARGRKNEKLKLDALKLSHHGSAGGTTVELLALLDCQRYLVSSNGNIFYHPDREAMARVILNGGKRPTLYFNYRSPLNELWDAPTLKARYDYRTEYPPEGQAGLHVPLASLNFDGHTTD
jgi:beta-lactamase superfamily II metal-dependent hydrolase